MVEDIAGGGSSRYLYFVWSLHIFYFINNNIELRINITGVMYQEGGWRAVNVCVCLKDMFDIHNFV